MQRSVPQGLASQRNPGPPVAVGQQFPDSISFHPGYELLTIGDADKVDKALVIIDKTLEVCEQKQDGHCLPELHRLRGECLLRKGGRVGAHERFEVALSIAKRQGAVALEQRVRASMDRAK